MNNQRASILSIGDELLIGETQNTNTTFIAKMLYELGFDVELQLAVGDDKIQIERALKFLFVSSNLVISTGGLGPTLDDITLTTFNNYFKGEIYENNQVRKWINEYMRKKGIASNLLNISQCMISTKAIPIRNYQGTASGLMFEENNKLIFALPGVPYEMKGLMDNGVRQIIAHRFNNKQNYHEYIYTKGIQESQIAILLQSIEEEISNTNIKIAYLPENHLTVKIRLSTFAVSSSKNLIYFQEVKKSIKIILNTYLS